MSSNAVDTQEPAHFFWFERKSDDFPFYRGSPVALTSAQWWLVMLGVAVGFAALIFPPPFLRGLISNFVPAVLYCVIPLAALAFVSGGAWTAIFRPLRVRDAFWIVGFAILNIAVTLVVGSITIGVMETTANEAVGSVATQSGGALALFFARTAIQLFGEEVMSILPFLAILYWLVARRSFGRKTAVILATVLVAIIFAAAHLPTYGWNVPQTLMGVGVARIVLLLPYIITKNILVSTGAHIVNDWMMFAVSIFVAGASSTDTG